MADNNRVARLAERPVGMVKADNFTITDEPLAEPGDGEFRVHVEYVSIDPAMRPWLNDVPSYIPAVQIGEVMRGLGSGIIEASNHPDFAVGDAVGGLFGVQTHAISNGKGVTRLDLSLAPLERWIAGLGMPGMTAYFGLLDVGRPKEGETVVVSAASGAVGSLVGQIAKIKGCRVVGIAGGPEKCKAVTDMGFDACVDYKAGNLAEDLRAACPKGIDIYWENVGGEIGDTVFPQMNQFGRVVICGLISLYNATKPPTGPVVMGLILRSRLRVQGFIVFDYADRYQEAIDDMGKWAADGKLVMREDVREGGIDAFVDVLNLLYTGGNNGKLVLKT
jgi:hypothetical protein